MQSVVNDRPAGETSLPPLGGKLQTRLVSADVRQDWLDRKDRLFAITLTPRQVSDIECLANGAFSPLEGFLGREDYESVVSEIHLASGIVWSIPITLAVTDDQARSLKDSGQALLTEPGGKPLAILHVEEIFSYDANREAELVYGTTEQAHPGVAILLEQPEWLVGGKVEVLDMPSDLPFEKERLTPEQVRSAISQRGWRSVVGFQTRNPIHRAHEYITKCALEMVDGLLLHPLVGETKEGDIPAEVRMQAYEALLAGYYPADRVMLSVFPAAMRYAGPREAIHHALCRRNYGCTHFIVGRDHAGVGNYYGTYDAQKIFGRFDPDQIGITPLFFDHSFWCNRCDQMATAKTCPHPESDRLALSGTEVRRRLSEGEELPGHFSRAEVAHALTQHRDSKA